MICQEELQSKKDSIKDLERKNAESDKEILNLNKRIVELKVLKRFNIFLVLIVDDAKASLKRYETTIEGMKNNQKDQNNFHLEKYLKENEELVFIAILKSYNSIFS